MDVRSALSSMPCRPVITAFSTSSRDMDCTCSMLRPTALKAATWDLEPVVIALVRVFMPPLKESMDAPQWPRTASHS